MIMEFDKYAESYDSSFMGKGSGRFYTDLIKELDVKDGDSILDVGCGTGSVLAFVGKQKNIIGYGLDVSANMITVAKEKNPVFKFVTGDSGDLPFEDESMDVVMACMAYHHFPDQERFRKEALRVLKPGGALYISDPRFPGVIRGFFNTCFKDAGFHSTKKNSLDFEKTGFITKNIIKDKYVQVLHLEKEI
jgi:ubiquinone/menaquinone biosynthesis C-methylase UbiE